MFRNKITETEKLLSQLLVVLKRVDDRLQTLEECVEGDRNKRIKIQHG